MIARIPSLLLLLFSVFPARADEAFPLPADLEADVRFWVSIFTEVPSTEGVLHDNRNLDVVYARFAVPEDLSRRARQRLIGKRRDAIKAVLKRLAKGKRDNLSEDEARILNLWPDEVSNATLAAAVKRVRFQQGLSDRFQDGLVRAGRWRAFIEREFDAIGIPAELAALPHVESSYNPNARSHVGASGIWQFTRSTGRRFMRVDHVVDERNDPFAATRAAGRLLAYNYSITGNWPMAITAYNHGLAGVRRAMKKYGESAYVDIFRKYNGRTFGFASRNFYVAFLAALRIDRDPEKYFPNLVVDAPLNYEWQPLPAFIPAVALASGLGVTPQQLEAHNPALQPSVWEGSKHVPAGFEVRLPAGPAEPLDERIGRMGADTWAGQQLPDLFHTVVRGDTLSQIAETYRTRVSTLVALNNLGSRHRIRAGQRLRLPAAAAAPIATAPVTVAAAPASRQLPDASSHEESAPTTMTEADTDAPASNTMQTALLSDPSDYSVADDGTIEVQPLETLGHYADWLGIRTQRLRDINGLAFRTPVQVGQRIKLDLAKSDVRSFEDRRVAYQRSQQDRFFQRYMITGVEEHVMGRGESIWILALRKYDVPVWLFRQYNPELDLHNVPYGKRVRFPVLTTTDRS